MCVFHTKSKTHSFKEVIDSSILPIYMFHEKGDEIIVLGRKKGYYKDYGFSCEVSNANWDDVQKQIEDTLEFLKRYYSILKKIKTKYEISDWRIDLPYTIRDKQHFFTQTDFFPPVFLRRLSELNIGLELSLYAPSDTNT